MRAEYPGNYALAITGHVTEQMREHYSSVALDEKRQALAAVVKLVPLTKVESGWNRRPKRAARAEWLDSSQLA